MKSSSLNLKAIHEVQGVKPSRLLEPSVSAMLRCIGFGPEVEEYQWLQPGFDVWGVHLGKDPLKIAMSSLSNKEEQNGGVRMFGDVALVNVVSRLSIGRRQSPIYCLFVWSFLVVIRCLMGCLMAVDLVHVKIAIMVSIPSEYRGEWCGAAATEKIGRKPSCSITLLSLPPPRRILLMRRLRQSYGDEG